MDSNIHKLILRKNPNAKLFQGLDMCIIVLSSDNRIIYDYQKIVDHYLRQGLNEETIKRLIRMKLSNLPKDKNNPIILFSIDNFK